MITSSFIALHFSAGEGIKAKRSVRFWRDFCFFAKIVTKLID